MAEIDRNLAEVIEKATETGEAIVTIECPCCHKTYYALKSEATYQDLTGTRSFKQLGRKCPHCGFSGISSPGNRRAQELERMEVEIEAERKAQKMLDDNATSWAEICNPKL